MTKQPKAPPDAEPHAVTTIGLLAAMTGYEVYDPNDDTATPVHVIGWLINEENGVNVTHPITTEGDPPPGWLLRDRGSIAASLGPPASR